ncbi:hypothetical protein AMAG_20754 [Allomyces macrogynus ATCC 38327]|uniref:Uncharacterized protein n=1 Tax=Allomyces macrogynus (strain ATCC 38327) TaxID=578462 RepID=A0A0L0TF43_ALLM3|nr:hypothetical protein AMAG_20754 [Allomyces macrogynus ATCC 38327]|eukprot:KNE73372.1 hypothetical protein AMAG_20754 [Allomyces macrogynus ATCC 38327]
MLDIKAVTAAQMHQAFAEQQMQLAQMHQQQLAEQLAAVAAATASAAAPTPAPAEKRAHPNYSEEGTDKASKRARIEEWGGAETRATRQLRLQRQWTMQRLCRRSRRPVSP